MTSAARSRDPRRKARDHVLAADLVEVAVLRELLGDGEDVHREIIIAPSTDSSASRYWGGTTAATPDC